MLTRKDLDSLHCGIPNCTHEDHEPMYLHGRCHIASYVEVSYFNGSIKVACAECKKVIAIIKVAEE